MTAGKDGIRPLQRPRLSWWKSITLALTVFANAESRGNDSVQGYSKPIANKKEKYHLFLVEKSNLSRSRETDSKKRDLQTSTLDDDDRIESFHRRHDSKKSSKSKSSKKSNNIFFHNSTDSDSSDFHVISSRHSKKSKKKSYEDGPTPTTPTDPPSISSRHSKKSKKKSYEDGPTFTPTGSPSASSTNTEKPVIPKEPPTSPRPTESPTLAPNNRCVVNSQGLFGSQIGIAEVVAYAYEITTVGDISFAEENELVIEMERSITNGVIDDLFPQCSAFVASMAEKAITKDETAAPKEKKVDSKEEKKKKSRKNPKRRLRTLQSNKVEGISTRPRDSIQDDECSGASIGFNCFVALGELTIYSTSAMDTTMLNEIQRAISDSIENGNLQDVDAKVLTVDERDLEKYPVGVTESPTQSPNSQSGRNAAFVFEPWLIGVISASGVLILGLILYFCRRRSRKKEKKGVVIRDDDSTGGMPSHSSPPPKQQRKSYILQPRPKYTPPIRRFSNLKDEPDPKSSRRRGNKTQRLSGNKNSQSSPTGNSEAFSGSSKSSPISAFGPASSSPTSNRPLTSSTGSEDYERASSGSEEKQNLFSSDNRNSTGFTDSDGAFGDPDNAFGTESPSSPGSEKYSSSSYSSYEEEVEEVYEIEYVEDEDGIDGNAEEDGEEFWDEDVVEEVVEEQEQPSLLPWRPSSVGNIIM